MFGTLGIGYRTEMLLLRIPPNEGVGERIVCQNGEQHPIPPGRIRHVDEAAFGESNRFVMLLSEGAKHIEVRTRLTNKVCFRAPLVGIETNEVNTLITRIPLKELLLGHIPI